MLTELRWIASLPSSALHAALAIFEGRKLVDGNLQVAIEAPARKLVVAVDNCGVKPERLLPHLVALSAGITVPLQSVEVAMMKVTDRETARAHAPRLLEVTRQVIAAFKTAVPDVLEQLELRGGPIRQQWEARGPGLLNQLAQKTDAELIPMQVEVVLVHPALGGGSRSFLPYNSVLLEAVVADPIANLPEPVRLGWSIGQLNCDLPKHQSDLTHDELSRAAALAMIPAVLAAAEEVELAHCDVARIQLALDNWVWPRHGDPIQLADQLGAWWDTYAASRPDWTVALGALRAMTAGCI
jgi:hypothetical protein